MPRKPKERGWEYHGEEALYLEALRIIRKHKIMRICTVEKADENSATVTACNLWRFSTKGAVATAFWVRDVYAGWTKVSGFAGSFPNLALIPMVQTKWKDVLDAAASFVVEQITDKNEEIRNYDYMQTEYGREMDIKFYGTKIEFREKERKEHAKSKVKASIASILIARCQSGGQYGGMLLMKALWKHVIDRQVLGACISIHQSVRMKEYFSANQRKHAILKLQSTRKNMLPLLQCLPYSAWKDDVFDAITWMNQDEKRILNNCAVSGFNENRHYEYFAALPHSAHKMIAECHPNKQVDLTKKTTAKEAIVIAAEANIDANKQKTAMVEWIRKVHLSIDLAGPKEESVRQLAGLCSTWFLMADHVTKKYGNKNFRKWVDIIGLYEYSVRKRTGYDYLTTPCLEAQVNKMIEHYYYREKVKNCTQDRKESLREKITMVLLIISGKNSLSIETLAKYVKNKDVLIDFANDNGLVVDALELLETEEQKERAIELLFGAAA